MAVVDGDEDMTMLVKTTCVNAVLVLIAVVAMIEMR